MLVQNYGSGFGNQFGQNIFQPRIRVHLPDQYHYFLRLIERIRKFGQFNFSKKGLNFGKLVRRNPDKKHLITDVLTGNLFKDEVDDLWPLIDALQAEERAAASACASVEKSRS